MVLEAYTGATMYHILYLSLSTLIQCILLVPWSVLHLYAFSIDSIVAETRLLFYLAQPVHVHESGEV